MNHPEQLINHIKPAAEAAPGLLSEVESTVFPQVVAAFRETYRILCTGANHPEKGHNGVIQKRYFPAAFLRSLPKNTPSGAERLASLSF
jgi:predicted aldo/keto reductase-like oxidoreductase